MIENFNLGLLVLLCEGSLVLLVASLLLLGVAVHNSCRLLGQVHQTLLKLLRSLLRFSEFFLRLSPQLSRTR